MLTNNLRFLSKLKESLGAENMSLYLKEKYDHDHYCDGDGVILVISNFFPFDSVDKPCKYCERLAKKRIEKKAKHDGETT